jgi:hypothetical protein
MKRSYDRVFPAFVRRDDVLTLTLFGKRTAPISTVSLNHCPRGDGRGSRDEC